MADTTYPVYGEITGPIVMIGFGSIGHGTLPLIERHFKYDKNRLIVVEPREDAKDTEIFVRHGVRHVRAAVTRDNYKELLKPLLTEGGGQGFCVNLSVDTSSLDIIKLCRKLDVLYVDTVIEPWLGFYFDANGQCRAHELRAARNRSPRKGKEPGRHDRRFDLRRQSRHGFLVRQEGPPQPRRRSRTEIRGTAPGRP